MATGINDLKLEETIKNIIEQVENLNSVFNRLDEEFTTVKNEIEGDFQVELCNKCTSICNQYETIKENIRSYAVDLNKVKTAYKNQDDEMQDIIITSINKVEERSES